MDKLNEEKGTLIVTGAHLADGLYYGKWSAYRIDIEIAFTQVAGNGMVLQKGTKISYRTEIGVRSKIPVEVLLVIENRNVYCKL